MVTFNNANTFSNTRYSHSGDITFIIFYPEHKPGYTKILPDNYHDCRVTTSTAKAGKSEKVRI